MLEREKKVVYILVELIMIDFFLEIDFNPVQHIMLKESFS